MLTSIVQTFESNLFALHFKHMHHVVQVHQTCSSMFPGPWVQRHSKKMVQYVGWIAGIVDTVKTLYDITRFNRIFNI